MSFPRSVFNTQFKRLYSFFPRRIPTKNRSKYLVTISGVTVAGAYFYIENKRRPKYPVELCPEYFTKYKITKRIDIDRHHYLLELTPLIPQANNIWEQVNARKLWSVEVKQPELMVVRNYTPLPLKFTEDDTLKQLEAGQNNHGKLIFYMKNYDEGEVAKWIRSLPQNHQVDIRGPFVEYEIPKGVNVINFFTAGTGLVSALQVMLNTSAPYTSTMHVFHSCKQSKELGPLFGILQDLQKNNPFFTYTMFDSSKHTDIRSQWKTFELLVPSATKIRGGVSLVCGPEDYITAIAGRKLVPLQGPIGGILKQKGWTNDNAFKLS
ncbi:oxidoreductase KNAG_0B03090 [Huiozyma naganishii CBS 8797]|uniref:FAD-binding FR-type domain-containing protein n=1 Tax=Huiozyma naganishii (strain ATCC MYA-139 / BCRC 22969 / CBS 8797 / KCTC 17520 / NBRC 10181 / NCYC 3082 / Yp74L-3) TaxID=1071383 RepID=J7S4R6_HUIN7|nr:hypothetical protein KNAG_0B03090 [Kazachstania naganishii CBS 8797]CCK68751.1 hypothetical protein KNAG_0B03090 [Kazachstania naganishii CBS 8797]